MLLLLAVFLVACEKLEYDAPEDQPLYFEYHYINHAWGFQENGWLIDHEGNAYQYVFLAQSGDWEQFNLSEEAEKLVKWLLDFDVFWLSD